MSGDHLIRIADAALAEATRRAGAWLACRPGCTPCCIGPFPISGPDAARLQEGLAALDAARAARVVARARDSVARMQRDYPGDTLTRVLMEDDAAENEPCPALDPETGRCDLYAARPITCRTFGPAIRMGDELLPVCELCFVGASDAEIDACAAQIDAEAFADEGPEETIVAYALAGA